MFNNVFSLVTLAYLSIFSTAFASPIMAHGYSEFHHDLSGFNGNWYAEATSPAIYDAFKKWYKESGYSCECVHTTLRADSDHHLDVTVSCNLHKDNDKIGQATVTGSFDLFYYSTGLYAFWYTNREVYYTTEDDPNTKHKVTGIYNYYKNGVYYYPVSPNNSTTHYKGYLEFTSYEDKTYSSLYTYEYLDHLTLDKVIKELDSYSVDLIKINTSSCH